MLKAIIIAGSLAAVALPAAAEEATIADITGTWSGKGTVQKDDKSRPMNVTCAVEGAQSGDQIGFDGECRAMLIMKRVIGAEIVRDGDRYTGTYIGSNAGPAELDGGQEEGKIVLNMRFPRTVNGDDIAVMTIETPSGDSFKITTTDIMDDGVTQVTTAEILFERK